MKNKMIVLAALFGSQTLWANCTDFYKRLKVYSGTEQAQEVIKLCTEGALDTEVYITAKSVGQTHQEALEAAKRSLSGDIDGAKYIEIVTDPERNETHADAIFLAEISAQEKNTEGNPSTEENQTEE